MKSASSSAGIILPAVATTAVISTNKSKPEIVNTVAEISTESGVLYAQPTANGYQLVNSIPKVIYILNKTNTTDVYLIEGQDGVVYKKE